MAIEDGSRHATVAIVMSNYNHARYLGDSLGGLAAQTRAADEIVLLDDGSTDESVRLLEGFARGNPAVRFLRNPQRLGVQQSIASVLPLVKSDYLVWTAADDRLLPPFLERSMAALERHPQAGLCFSETTQLLGDSGATLRFANDPGVARIFDLSDLPEYLAPQDLLARMKRAYLPIASNTVIVKRQALLRLGGYPRELEWNADSFAYVAIALRNGACVIPDTLALVRTTPGSYSQAMHDPARQAAILGKALDLLATPDYADVRGLLRAGPSNFSPADKLILRVFLHRPRDWDLLIAYARWRVDEHQALHRVGLGRALLRALQRLPALLRSR